MSFGDLVPVRPGAGTSSVCLRGHQLDLDLYDKLASYSHRYKLHGTLCEACRAQEDLDPSARRLAEWVHVDVTTQFTPETASAGGLVVHQPPAGTISGRLELRLDGREAPPRLPPSAARALQRPSKLKIRSNEKTALPGSSDPVGGVSSLWS